MLKLSHVNVYYRNLQALKDISLDVEAGEIVCLIGSNGSGKSTILRTISGLIRPVQGTIAYQGEDITAVAAEKLVVKGISHVPEGRRIFHGLTVSGNLEVGTASWRRHGDRIDRDMAGVLDIFPALKKRIDQLGWSLSGGEQQMLAIARSLMSRPKLLLLDEPSLGLAPKLVAAVFETIEKINRHGTTILLVEQNACSALRIAHRGYVMANGSIVRHGTAEELARNEKVKKAYLGG